MESAVVASACARHGVPCVCVRAVSDDAQTGLSPRLVQLLSGARVSWWRLLLAIIRSPRLLAECMRLGKATRLAAERLAAALHELIDGSLAPAETAGGQIGEAHRRDGAQADRNA